MQLFGVKELDLAHGDVRNGFKTTILDHFGPPNGLAAKIAGKHTKGKAQGGPGMPREAQRSPGRPRVPAHLKHGSEHRRGRKCDRGQRFWPPHALGQSGGKGFGT